MTKYIYILFLIFSCKEVKKEYYEDGSLKSQSTYKSNEKEGKSVTYYKGEEIKEVTFWSNDVLNGEKINYYPNGKISSLSFWKNGIQDSIYKLFYDNGNIEDSSFYILGLKNGYYKNYYRNGNLKQEGVIYKGLVKGKVIDYYENYKNKIYSIANVINVNGEYRNTQIEEYNPDGTVKFKMIPIRFKTLKDTFLLNKSFQLEIHLDSAKFQKTKIIIGNYDEQFQIKNSPSYDTIIAINHSVKININPTKKGINYLRGFVRNSGIISSDKKTYKVKVVDRYFEYIYYVK